MGGDLTFAPARDREAGKPPHHLEDAMQIKLSLNLDALAVESFEAGKVIPPAENVLTCLNTNCGKILCCA